VNGGWLRAAGAEEIARAQRLTGGSGRPLNFTVRRRECLSSTSQMPC